MDIATRKADGVKVVDFEGSLDTNTSPDAEAHLTELVSQGANKVLVSFEKLDYISSAGLRVLLAVAKLLKSGGGDLRICCLNETVQEVFDITGFGTILNVFGSESEALEGF